MPGQNKSSKIFNYGDNTFSQGVVITDENGIPFALPTSEGQIELQRLLSLDAFGYKSVASPYPLLDSFFKYGRNDDVFDYEITNVVGASVTHLPNESSVQLTVSGNGDKIIAGQRKYNRYQAGNQLMIEYTGVLGDIVANTYVYQGYFDSQNGIFMGVDGTEFLIGLRSYVTGSTVDDIKHRGEFNIDNINGEGPSGFSYDVTKGNIHSIKFQWLGMGNVLASIVTDFAVSIPVHMFRNINVKSAVYMTTATLPYRIEIGSTGGSKSMKATCVTIKASGGQEPPQSEKAFDETNFPYKTITNGVETPLIAFRLKQQINSIDNRAYVLPRAFKFYAKQDEILFNVYYTKSSANVTGGSWISTGLGTSDIIEYNKTFTAWSWQSVLASRKLQAQATSPAQADINASEISSTGQFSMSRNHLNTDSDTIIYTARSINATTVQAAMGLDWSEIT